MNTDDASLHDAEIRSWLETALEQEPLSARGLRLLGDVDQIAQRPQEAQRFFNAAAKLSLQEWRAVRMSMQSAFAAGDYDSSARFADVLLRTHPQLFVAVAPTLAQMSENDKAVSAVDGLLTSAPPWRRTFFEGISAYITDARTPMHLLLNLRTTSSPASIEERAPYLRFLIDHKLYDLAYYAWLQFLPTDELARAGLLYNGDFEQAPSGLPFDWVIGSGKSVSVETISTASQHGSRSLSIEFGNGRVEFPSVTEMTMVPPGSYKFKGRYKGEVRGVRGLVWRISCVSSSQPLIIGESQMVLGSCRQWTDFDFSFAVPPAECRAQSVNLVLDARSPSETLVTGSIQYDDLEIVRD